MCEQTKTKINTLKNEIHAKVIQISDVCQRNHPFQVFVDMCDLIFTTKSWKQWFSFFWRDESIPHEPSRSNRHENLWKSKFDTPRTISFPIMLFCIIKISPIMIGLSIIWWTSFRGHEIHHDVNWVFSWNMIFFTAYNYIDDVSNCNLDFEIEKNIHLTQSSCII